MLSAPKLRTASLRQRHHVGAVLDQVGGVFGVEEVVRLASDALAQNLRRQRLNFSQNFRDFGARRAQHAFCLPIVRCARRQTWAKLSLESEQRLALQNRAPGAEFVQNFPFENLRIDCKHFANLLRF